MNLITLSLFLILCFLFAPTILIFLSRYTAHLHREDLKRIKNLPRSFYLFLRSVLFCISHEHEELSRVPEALPGLIISYESRKILLLYLYYIILSRMRECQIYARTKGTKEKERELSRHGGSNVGLLRLLFRTHRDMRARSRVATRHGRKRSGQHQKFREAYLHFNKRYYWVLRRGTT